MSLPALTLLTEEQTDVRHAVRRLRWFRRAFVEQVASVSRNTGTHYEMDTARLAEAFFSWVQEFERLKPDTARDRRRYVDFAAGLMLHRLLTHQPLAARDQTAGGNAPDRTPAEFWPEGYACVAFCLNVRQAVLLQDFNERTEIGTAIDDLRNWWSFRENAAEDPASIIGFFHLFAGARPEWATPDIFIAAPSAKDRASPPRLRLLDGGRDSGSAPLTLPAGLELVAFDLAALSNLDELLRAEIAFTLKIGGLRAEPEDVAAFHGASLGALMTHLALRRGRFCPDTVSRAFHNRLRERLHAELALHPAAERILSQLSQSGVSIDLMLTDPKLTEEDIPASLLPQSLAGSLRFVSASGEACHIATTAARVRAKACAFVSADPERLARARALGFTVIGVGGAAQGADIPGIAELEDFPGIAN